MSSQPESQGRTAGLEGIYPLVFSAREEAAGSKAYLSDGGTRKMLEFFEAKGLAALKQEDREEKWYGDWVAYQKEHGIYAGMLSPAEYSAGGGFDLLRYARFLEVFAYCSPAHGYSVQVTFLGLFSILMGTNKALKQEAVAALKEGGLLGFGVSEKGHGSDLLANEFTVAETAGGFAANGRKYYIGNTHVASMIAVLGKKVSSGAGAPRVNRAPFVLIALRPRQAAGFKSLGKIRTLGVRAADVGAFEVKEQTVPAGDVIAEGREAWDAVFGTVTLGKFFLGFGSIGMCEHALEEAAAHLRQRVLYGKPAIEMPHIRARMSEAYARLTAMKLYAYRALDYLHAAAANDRRYQLFCAVQKARVSTEGVKVMALLAECMGARGLESETYFEMALRDVQLIPGLEGSMHINLGLAAQFLGRYFDRWNLDLAVPASLVGAEIASRQNDYLMEARTGGTHAIAFRPFLEAYRELAGVANVALFARQAAAFRRVCRRETLRKEGSGGGGAETAAGLLLGQCFSTVVYGQLVAEQAVRLGMRREMVSVIFGLLVADLSAWGIQLASMAGLDEGSRELILRMLKAGRTAESDWQFIAQDRIASVT